MGICESTPYVDPADSLVRGTLTSSVWMFPPRMPEEWSHIVFIYTHETLRHEVMRLEQMAAAMKGNEASFNDLELYIKTYVKPYMQWQHKLEEKIIFPAVAKKVPILRTISAARSQNNAKLDAVMSAIASKDKRKVEEAMAFLAEHLGDLLAEKEFKLVPEIDNFFDIQWLKDITAQSMTWSQTSFPREWPLCAKMTYDAAKIFSMDSHYKSDLPSTLAEKLDTELHEDFAKPKAALIKRITA